MGLEVHVAAPGEPFRRQGLLSRPKRLNLQGRFRIMLGEEFGDHAVEPDAPARCQGGVKRHVSKRLPPSGVGFLRHFEVGEHGS